MAASLFRAMMCFLNTSVFVYELFPTDNVFFDPPLEIEPSHPILLEKAFFL